MKISEKLAQAEATQTPYIAFEFYPPRTADGVANLTKRFGRMQQQNPLYADITWGAGGSTSDLTLSIATAMKEAGMEPNMHLTCTNMQAELITTALEGARKAGITNIVALRGDPPAGQAEWKAVEGGFTCALDLVQHIRKDYGSEFCISVAGYPEGHPTVIKKVAPEQVRRAAAPPERAAVLVAVVGDAAPRMPRCVASPPMASPPCPARRQVLSDSEKLRLVTLDDGDYVCSDAVRVRAASG